MVSSIVGIVGIVGIVVLVVFTVDCQAVNGSLFGIPNLFKMYKSLIVRVLSLF